MFWEEQAAPQPPQLPGPLLVSTSQPSPWRSPLQSPKPGAHGLVQAPAVQVTAVTWLLEQATLQPPQLSGSTAKLVSQPLLASPSQSPKPFWQTIWQAPATQP